MPEIIVQQYIALLVTWLVVAVIGGPILAALEMTPAQRFIPQP